MNADKRKSLENLFFSNYAVSDLSKLFDDPSLFLKQQLASFGDELFLASVMSRLIEEKRDVELGYFLDSYREWRLSNPRSADGCNENRSKNIDDALTDDVSINDVLACKKIINAGRILDYAPDLVQADKEFGLPSGDFQRYIEKNYFMMPIHYEAKPFELIELVNYFTRILPAMREMSSKDVRRRIFEIERDNIIATVQICSELDDYKSFHKLMQQLDEIVGINPRNFMPSFAKFSDWGHILYSVHYNLYRDDTATYLLPKGNAQRFVDSYYGKLKIVESARTFESTKAQIDERNLQKNLQK